MKQNLFGKGMNTKFDPDLKNIKVLELNKEKVEQWQMEEVKKIKIKEEKYKLKVK